MTSNIEGRMAEPEHPLFQYYDPYLTYSDPDGDCIVAADGQTREDLNADTGALFHVGKEAFQRLVAKMECSREEFISGYKGYLQGLQDFRRSILDSQSRGALVFSNGKQPISVEKLDDDVVVSICWQMYSATRSAAKTDNEVREMYRELFLFHAIKEIDNALVGIALGGSDSIAAAVAATSALANAVAIESGDEHLVEARSRLAFEAATEKYRRDPKQREKAFVRECWEQWQKNPISYESKASFARDMLSKCEHLVSTKKIEDWCRQWEAEAR